MTFRCSILALLAFGASIGTTAAAKAGEREPAPARSAEISVLTYNVRGMPWPAARNRGTAMGAIGRELAQMRREGRQPDVVLIQEGFVGDMAKLAQASGYRYWVKGPDRKARPAAPLLGARYYLVGEGWGKFAGSGLHILTDLPPDRVATLTYSACAGLDCLAAKGAMLVHLAVPGLPGGVDVVNTHMNSRTAAKVPWSRSLTAHHRQVDELTAFIAAERDAESSLLVGGDFNVKNAPDRYEHDRPIRPFTVVSEFCTRVASCEGQPADQGQPWLKSQDLQGFASPGAVSLRPIRIGALFASPDTGGRLSDHDGYLVRYQLTWRAPAAQPAPQLVAGIEAPNPIRVATVR